MIRFNFDGEESVTLIRDGEYIYTYLSDGMYRFLYSDIQPNCRILSSCHISILFFASDITGIKRVKSNLCIGKEFCIYLNWDDYEKLTRTFRYWKDHKNIDLEYE